MCRNVRTPVIEFQLTPLFSSINVREGGSSHRYSTPSGCLEQRLYLCEDGDLWRSRCKTVLFANKSVNVGC